jgi:signal transduction histidine kinase
MLNLCMNARDAMPSGGTVTIRATSVDAPGERSMRIDVQDTGEGIADDVLPKIFEPFFTTKEAGKGAGLGLASADAFARECGGSILVESRAGAGACFSLRLPMVAPDEEASRPNDRPAASV